MKKIIFYIMDYENNESAKKIFLNSNNSLIKYNDGAWFFSSKFTGIENLDVKYGLLSLEEIVAIIPKLTTEAKKLARKISEEVVGDNKEGMDLNSSLLSLINKIMYIEDEKPSFLNVSTELFIRIIYGHNLTNGNKRTGVTFLKLFLWRYGYYFKWTGGEIKDYTKHKTVIEKFVKSLEKTKNEFDPNYLAIKNKIYLWIKDNVIIGLNWR